MQGVRLEFVAVDSILLEALRKITLNVTQIGRAARRTVYQHKGEHRTFIHTIVEQDMVEGTTFSFSLSQSHAPTS